MFQIFAINIVLISPPQVQAEFMSPTARAQIELWFHLHSFLQTRMKLICFSICCTILGHQNQNFSHKQKIEIRLLNFFFFLLLPDMFVTKKYKAVIVSHLPNTQTNSFNATICIDTHTSVSMNSPLEKQCEFFWIWAKQGPWKGKVSCLKLLIQCCFGQILNHYLYVVTNILVYWLFFFLAVICRHWIF